MRRCPQCQAPNPTPATTCHACGVGLPGPPGLWARSEALWRSPAPGRTVAAVLLPLAFQLSTGSLLAVGAKRQEGHFAAFHVLNGLILGLVLAWVWRETRVKDWGRWAVFGLAGGLLAEALEIFCSYRHWMGLISFSLWKAAGLPDNLALQYELLQVFRLAGPALALGVVSFRKSPSKTARRRIALWTALGLALRSRVRGAWVAWPVLGSVLGWEHLALCGASFLALIWGMGPRDLTSDGQIP